MNPNPNNVTPIESKQPQPSCRFTITCMLSGFPVELQGEGRAGDLKVIIDRLLSIGAEPPVAKVSNDATLSQKSAPTCPDHGTVMKPSKRPGQFYCPRALPDGGYCRHSAKA